MIYFSKKKKTAFSFIFHFPNYSLYTALHIMLSICDISETQYKLSRIFIEDTAISLENLNMREHSNGDLLAFKRIRRRIETG